MSHSAAERLLPGSSYPPSQPKTQARTTGTNLGWFGRLFSRSTHRGGGDAEEYEPLGGAEEEETHGHEMDERFKLAEEGEDEDEDEEEYELVRGNEERERLRS